jgi:serine/threonine-protein kinase RsbW
MEIKLTLALPREEVSVPVVRRVLGAAMKALGVEAEVIQDIELALSEAVTNVLDHAAKGEEYQVSAGIDGNICVIEIVDRGEGFDGSGLGHDKADLHAEEGRGIQLMRALVDKVTFTNIPTKGTVVHLEKRLEWQADSAIRQLTDGNPATEHGPWSATSDA